MEAKNNGWLRKEMNVELALFSGQNQNSKIQFIQMNEWLSNLLFFVFLKKENLVDWENNWFIILMYIIFFSLFIFWNGESWMIKKEEC